jgi:hypothetical protein
MLYIKNISNSTGAAYMDAEGIFRLHFRYESRRNLSIGDKIALYQNIDGNINITHFVHIIDTHVREDKNENPVYTHFLYVQIIAKGAIPVKSLATWSQVGFQGHAAGGNLVSEFQVDNQLVDDISRAKLSQELWQAYFANVHNCFAVTRVGYLKP